ncbi:endochitinase A-like isoform X1 [Nicotiana tomentosiformis]|uniref:endochitinase A-like isoform X1 n=1 Tax=Nicotiana tomentosiformis TaxID=4098 RepID=UPI00051ACAFC|nr:mucin-5AC-like isoform X1 [Nicotiana tomentosiformis]
MNGSFRAEETAMRQLQQQMGSFRNSVMKEKEEELALFLEMRRREKDRNDLLLFQNGDEFDAPLGLNAGGSPLFNIGSATTVRKNGADDFLNAENDKNDYEWLLTPPSTPLFPSLEMESEKSMMSRLGTAKARPTALKSRLANPQPEPSGRSILASRQLASTHGLNTSNSGLRRPSSSGGSRPSTPTGRPTLSAISALTSASRRTSTAASKSMTSTATSRTVSTTTSSRPSRSSTPTSRATLPSAKSTVPPRSSTPTSRSSARSSTPTTRASSTPTTRASVAGSKSTSRVATPTRRPTSVSSTATATAPLIKSPSSVTTATTTARNPGYSRASSPTVKPRPWKPSDIPGFSLDAPPNLRTSLSDRPISATRGRPGAPNVRSSSIEPVTNGRIRRQSCSPARGRPPNGVVRSSGSSVPIPAMSRLHAKANDNVSPGLIGTKMVERVVNMRKLAPPAKQDNKYSPRSNLSANSSSPDSSGFGRTLSKKSLDMAMRHMDIRRSIPGILRPSMTNIPASSMYSVRSGPNRSRTVSVSDSPLHTSSNASSEVSINNNAVCVDGSEVDDAISSDKGVRSPAGMRGR